jgi:uncharacterized membrane protein YhfC
MDLVSLTRFLNGFLMIALPIILGVFLVYTFKSSWKIWLIGGATFIISQVFHLPFNSYVLNPMLSAVQQLLPSIPGSLSVAVILGLSAGVFEECARYAMFRWWLQDKHSWRTAILAGAGHGGAEAIFLGVVVMWVFINMVAVRNADLSKLNIAPDQLDLARQQVQAYWSLPWFYTLFGALERIFTIPFHIMASVVVLQVFTRRPGQQQLGWLGLAIALHTLMDASAVFIAGQWSGYAAEAVLGGLAVIDIFIIFALRQPEPEINEPTTTSTPQVIPEFTPKPIEETSENLDKTRFQ